METGDRTMADDGETSEENVVGAEDQHRAHDWIHSFKVKEDFIGEMLKLDNVTPFKINWGSV